jgi:hypothetical protein
MKLLQLNKILLLLVAIMVDGCAVGYNTTLFTTKSNIGLDVDTKPPVAEISISRQEGVLAPGFEGGQTPPVIASFQTNTNAFSRFFFGVKSTFAGGDAAIGISQKPDAPAMENMSGLCLSKKPDTKKLFGWDLLDVSVPEAGQIKPFFFTTDTSLGLKLAWSGMTGPFPDTIRLGFHRNELALAPVYGTDKTKNCMIPGTDTPGVYAIWMPSFLAVLDNDVTTGLPTETKSSWHQYFATGKAATTLSNNKDVRKTMRDNVYPEPIIGTIDNSDPVNFCVRTWLNADQSNADILQKWWGSGIAAIDIYYPGNKQKRDDFIREKSIPCS